MAWCWKATFPQCALGLKTPEGLPILKYTTIWSNSEYVVYQFSGVECRCECDHGDIKGNFQGQPRSKLAQVWPPRMCKMIVEGVRQQLQESTSRQAYAVSPGLYRMTAASRENIDDHKAQISLLNTTNHLQATAIKQKCSIKGRHKPIVFFPDVC